jgi:hypothetical protein
MNWLGPLSSARGKTIEASAAVTLCADRTKPEAEPAYVVSMQTEIMVPERSLNTSSSVQLRLQW